MKAKYTVIFKANEDVTISVTVTVPFWYNTAQIIRTALELYYKETRNQTLINTDVSIKKL